MQEVGGPLHAGESVEALRKMFEHAGLEEGPEFRVDEVVVLKGYRYRITGIEKNEEHPMGALTLTPEGPTPGLTERKEAARRMEEELSLSRRLRGRRPGQK